MHICSPGLLLELKIKVFYFTCMIIISKRVHEEVAEVLSVLRESIIRQHFHPGHDSSVVYSLRYGQHTVCGGVELVSSLPQQPA